ncbi:hypothetical protein HHX47_DHR5000788, partial [Lentinula edodes]
ISVSKFLLALNVERYAGTRTLSSKETLLTLFSNVLEAREICWFKSLVSFLISTISYYLRHSSLVSMPTLGSLRFSSLHLLLLCVLSSIVFIITSASPLDPEPKVVLDIELIRQPHVGILPIAAQFDKNDNIIPPPAVDAHGKPVAHPIDSAPKGK